MVDNQHKQISGYRDLTQSEIDAMKGFSALVRSIARPEPRF